MIILIFIHKLHKIISCTQFVGGGVFSISRDAPIIEQKTNFSTLVLIKNILSARKMRGEQEGGEIFEAQRSELQECLTQKFLGILI